MVAVAGFSSLSEPRSLRGCEHGQAPDILLKMFLFRQERTEK